MYLQKMRFGGRVEFDVDCQVDENSVIVPTFTFQPILENAIIHGISPKVEGGKVFIRIWQQEDMLLIDVGDTGVGMDKETLESIKKQLAGGEDIALDADIVGIGLGNINRRIRAMYPGSSFEIESEQNKGTIVKIKLPIKGAGE